MNNTSTYYVETREELLPFVPENISKTLDVGCGKGFFSCLLKEKYCVEAWGVEMVPEAGISASEKLDKVYTGSFEEVFDKLPMEYFDCIFFNDVLEHMVDPYTVLEKSKTLLSRRGLIICSIPNVRYFPNLFNLIVKKDWQYVDSGVLDRTHLRFFTKKSIRRMFNEIDFDVVSIKGINAIASRKYRLFYYLVNAVTFGMCSDTYHLQYACVVKLK